LQCYENNCYSEETTSEPIVNDADHSSSDDIPSTTSNIESNDDDNDNDNKKDKKK